MHFSTVLSLALLSTSLVPTSLNGGTSLILGASAQPAYSYIPSHDTRDPRRRKRTALGYSHHAEILAGQEGKRQLAVSSGMVQPSSAVIASVTAGRMEGVSSAPIVTSGATTTPAITSTTNRAVPTSISTATSATLTSGVSSAAVTDTESDPAVTAASTTSTTSSTSSSVVTSVSSSVQASTSVSSTRLSSRLSSSSSSVMSSATTNAEGSVSYVTAVETIHASTSSASSLAADFTSLETVFATASATGNSSAAAASSKSETNDSGGLSTGVIIGISVAGGVVVLAIALFILWKLKQKRFSGYDDDVDGIKWPELNSHGESSTMNLPLPAKPTGGHGFETNALERSRMDMDDDGMDDYDSYTAPLSYANSVKGHYAYPQDTPPLPTMEYMDGGNGAYGMTTTAGGDGVTLGRNKSSGGYSVSDDHHTPLGGTRAFETDGPEMLQMTGDQYQRSDDGHNANLGRSRSGRLL